MTDVPTVDGYTDLVPIGTGGIGDVFRAVSVSTGTTVAVKLLRDVTDRSVAWHRTRREFEALHALGGHPHVIRVVEVLHDAPGIVMDHAPGGSVADLLARRGPTLPVPQVVLIGRDTADALRSAHECGIIHRDVKPQNLLVGEDGRIRLCDFGIASLTRSDEFRTRTSARSTRYASPEDLEEDVPVGPPTDVYSLGATMVHLLHGSPPSLKDRLAPWTPPPTDDPERAELDRIVAHCLHPEPTHRPTARDVLEWLSTLDHRLTSPCGALPLAAPPPVQEPPPADDTVPRGRSGSSAMVRPETPPRRRWRWPLGIGLAAATLIGLVGVGGLDVLSGSDGSDSGVLPRPPDLVALDDPTIVWPLGEVGECLVQVAESTSLQPVDCDRPHDLERFHRGELGDVDGEVTTDRLDAEVERECLSAAPPTDPNSPIRIAASGPGLDSWRSGDRTFQCFFGVSDGRTSGPVAAKPLEPN